MKGQISVKILLTINLIAISSVLYAQKNSCSVLKKDIADSYIGDCKKGLAHGEGVAIGIDKYEGHFKKGLPHGKGTYRYNDGSVYIGDWYKGLRNGKGEYTFKIEEKDSIIIGYWKNDKYIGKSKNEAEYQVPLRRGIETYSFHKLNETNNRLEIYFERNMKRFTPPDVRVSISSGYKTTSGLNLVIDDLRYPFTGAVRYSVLNKLGTNMANCELEFTIEKPGKWQIILKN